MRAPRRLRDPHKVLRQLVRDAEELTMLLFALICSFNLQTQIWRLWANERRLEVEQWGSLLGRAQL